MNAGYFPQLDFAVARGYLSAMFRTARLHLYRLWVCPIAGH